MQMEDTDICSSSQKELQHEPGYKWTSDRMKMSHCLNLLASHLDEGRISDIKARTCRWEGMEEGLQNK